MLGAHRVTVAPFFVTLTDFLIEKFAFWDAIIEERKLDGFCQLMSKSYLCEKY